MISGIWRRLRAALPSRPAPPGPGQQAGQQPAERRPSFYEYDQPPAARPAPAPAAGPVTAPVSPEPPQTADQVAERLSLRLFEDESLRRELEDEAAQPLLDWASSRTEQLRGSVAGLPPIAGAVRLARAGAQLFELVRTVNLAIGERGRASVDLTYSRFQLLDTFLEPPLFPSEEAAGLARGRLEALLDQPPEWFQTAPAPELVRRLVEILD
jgi:hypothetical protein